MTDFISELVDRFGATAIAEVLDTIKELGFSYATRAGVTISKNDIQIPPDKEKILVGYEEQVGSAQRSYDRGLITEDERHEQVVVALEQGDRRRRRGDEPQPRRAEPRVHDGQLRRPRIVQADPPAGRDARPHGKPEGRDHRAPDQVQLHGGPVGAGVLHLHARCPQGPRRHGAPHGRLRVPDPAAGRRLAGRDHPRGRLQVRRVHGRPGEDAGRRPESLGPARPA